MTLFLTSETGGVPAQIQLCFRIVKLLVSHHDYKMSLFTGQYTPVQPPGYNFFPYLSCAAKMTPHQVEHALWHLPSLFPYLSCAANDAISSGACPFAPTQPPAVPLLRVFLGEPAGWPCRGVRKVRGVCRARRGEHFWARHRKMVVLSACSPQMHCSPGLVGFRDHSKNIPIGLARTVFDISVYGNIPYIYRIYTG